MRGQVCLLPPSRVPAVVDEVMAEHPGSYVLDDAYVEPRDRPGRGRPSIPVIPSDRVVVIGYTSGSTGRPRPNPKTWGGFAACTALNASRLRDVLPREVGRAPAVDRGDRAAAAHVRDGTFRPDAVARRHGYTRRRTRCTRRTSRRRSPTCPAPAFSSAPQCIFAPCSSRGVALPDLRRHRLGHRAAAGRVGKGDGAAVRHRAARVFRLDGNLHHRVPSYGRR